MKCEPIFETRGRADERIACDCAPGRRQSSVQEGTVDVFHSETHTEVERAQTFGFTSVPLKQDETQQPNKPPQKTEGLADFNHNQPTGPSAEAIVLYLNGSRSHPVIIAIDDRRHRPYGLKEGESAQYDHNGQMTLIKNDGVYLISTGDNRKVSLRHVQKNKQKRPPAAQQAAQHNGGGDYKHEGETVNMEIRATKNRIEFCAGDTVVGYYDKPSTTWVLTGKVKLGAENATKKATIEGDELSEKVFMVGGGGTDPDIE